MYYYRQSSLDHFFVVAFFYIVFIKYGFSSEVKLDATHQYIVHFLGTAETQNLLLQKCCPSSEVLNKDGDCVRNQVKVEEVQTLSLEKRIKRAIHANHARQSHETGSTEGLQNEDAFTLRFNFERPSCEENLVRRMLFTKPSEIQLTSSLQFVTNKFMRNGESSNQSLIVNTKNYCVDYRDSEKGVVVEFCVPKNAEGFIPVSKGVSKRRRKDKYNPLSAPAEGGSPVLLRKCCKSSHVMDMINFTCVRHDIPWQLYPIISPEYQKSTWNSEPKDDDASDRVPLQVSWITGPPTCELSYEVSVDKYERYYVNSDGELVTEQNGTVAKTPPKEYCIDAVLEDYDFLSQNNDVNMSNAGFLQENQNNIFFRQMAIVCFENNINSTGLMDGDSERKFNWRKLYAVLTGISSVFLLATCSVYTLLRHELKLPGWLQFAYSVALLQTFSLLTIAQLWTQAIHDISKNLCRALGYGLHFSFLVCFFYLTSMNFEIFSSFRAMTLIAHGFGKSRGKKRFLEFTAFSIGFPTAITALLLAVDSCDPKKSNLEGSLCVLPTTGIGVESCVFDSKHKVAQLHYFYGFVGILLMINLVIFVCTLVSLRNRERETRMAKRQSTATCDYDRFQLFTRLFLIMGILWIFEVISWLFEYFEVDDGIQDVFIITDCLNASQGFAVFLMFVCKRQTWRQLKKKFATRFGMHTTRPLYRPNLNGTISSSNATNGTSVKSSHLSSTKSRDSDSILLAATTVASSTTAVGIVCATNSLKLDA